MEQDIRLQREIRDELVVEYNDVKKSENDKKKIEMKIENIDEKIQASSSSNEKIFVKIRFSSLFLGALTILYCAGKPSTRLETIFTFDLFSFSFVKVFNTVADRSKNAILLLNKKLLIKKFHHFFPFNFLQGRFFSRHLI